MIEWRWSERKKESAGERDRDAVTKAFAKFAEKSQAARQFETDLRSAAKLAEIWIADLQRALERAGVGEKTIKAALTGVEKERDPALRLSLLRELFTRCEAALTEGVDALGIDPEALREKVEKAARSKRLPFRRMGIAGHVRGEDVRVTAPTGKPRSKRREKR